MRGQEQQHEMRRGFTCFLSDQSRLFGLFAGDMIVKGSLEFISVSKVEHDDSEKFHLPPDACETLKFFRTKTGITEPYAFCFPEDTDPEDEILGKYIAAIPSIMLYLADVNDLLSFYKEELKPW
ncbi:hypothetical protein BBP40_003938 [Aspergillus hancockii]|nr:hypothetical protein BBP40_003938 [Aspergillus hancockii]